MTNEKFNLRKAKCCRHCRHGCFLGMEMRCDLRRKTDKVLETETCDMFKMNEDSPVLSLSQVNEKLQLCKNILNDCQHTIGSYEKLNPEKPI